MNLYTVLQTLASQSRKASKRVSTNGRRLVANSRRLRLNSVLCLQSNKWNLWSQIMSSSTSINWLITDLPVWFHLCVCQAIQDTWLLTNKNSVYQRCITESFTCINNKKHQHRSSTYLLEVKENVGKRWFAVNQAIILNLILVHPTFVNVLTW